MYRTRRYRRRRPNRRRKVYLGRYSIKRRREPSYNFAKYKLRGSDHILSDVSGTINTIYSISNPTTFFNGSGTLQDWAQVSQLYDQYRITGIKLKFVPSAPFDTSIQTTYEPMYILMDVDSNSVTPGVATAIQYESLKIKNMYRSWSVYYKIPKLIGGAVTQSTQGWFPTQSPVSTGAIYVWSFLTNLSADFGSIICTYYVKVKARR